MDLNRLVLCAGDVPLLWGGSPASEDITSQQRALEGPDVKLQIDLGIGHAAEEFVRRDLTEQYVHINGTYTTCGHTPLSRRSLSFIYVSAIGPSEYVASLAKCYK